MFSRYEAHKYVLCYDSIPDKLKMNNDTICQIYILVLQTSQIPVQEARTAQWDKNSK